VRDIACIAIPTLGGESCGRGSGECEQQSEDEGRGRHDSGAQGLMMIEAGGVVGRLQPRMISCGLSCLGFGPFQCSTAVALIMNC
jgi:hypothetical protein